MMGNTAYGTIAYWNIRDHRLWQWEQIAMSGQESSQSTERRTRWGILGTGGIARKFADVLNSLPDAQLVAVGSRTQATADEFGKKFGVRHRHASYAALADDPEVEVVYISTGHPLHKENMVFCLQSRKAVL